MNNPKNNKLANIGKLKLMRLQDFVFEHLTLLFAGTTLLALSGIIISLAVSAWPALEAFGFPFFYTIEWDIINSEFGGLIAIFGTLSTA